MDADELVRSVARYQAPLAPVYALPPGTAVTLCTDADEAEALLEAFIAAPAGALGLDTEWADARCSVALLQLATRTTGCLILRLPRLARVPAALRDLLLDESKLKCGVAVAHDLRLLETQFGLPSRGFVDLQPLASHHGYTQHGLGLASICRGVLGASMKKSLELRQSDWAGGLSPEQVEYAACDAFVAVEILEEVHRRHALPGTGVREWCQEYVDRVPKGLRQPSQANGTRACRKEAVVHAPQRKTALYGGCRLLSPTGVHLANVSGSKALWYVAQGLGERVEQGEEDGAVVVRLTFEPKGVGHAGDAFYLQTMENRCVGCGLPTALVRFSIVPHVFRSQLPLRFKEHSSHDIVLLCHTCFVVASDASQSLRRRHLRECGLTEASSPGAANKYAVDQEKLCARGAAVALQRTDLPAAVRSAKEAIVREFLGRSGSAPLAREDLEAVRNTGTRFAVEGYVPPEVTCAGHLGITEASKESRGGSAALEQRCLDFVVGWRRCFLETVRPRFLPEGWDVDRSIRKHDDLFGPGLPPGALGSEGI